jgi:hypothetical protein
MMTEAEMNQMLEAAVAGKESSLASDYPEFWASLKSQVEEIKARGDVVGGFAD